MATFELWGTGPTALAVEVIAVSGGASVETPFFMQGVTNRTPTYLADVAADGQAPALVSPAGVKLGFADMLAAVSPGLPADVAALCVAADAVASAAVCPLIGLPAGPGSADPKQSMDGLEAMLLFAGKPFLGGEAPAAADYAVAATFFPLYTMVMDATFLAGYPTSAAYLERVYGSPAMVAAYEWKAAPADAPVTPATAPALLETADAWGARAQRAIACKWSAGLVRQTFIDFFRTKAHTFWASSSVVPHNDPTLLFTNAGMNQFKPIFLGTADPAAELSKLKAATNSQKCIRAGGKHNDLDDVGKDVYHHTFFEMLGNWSFGNYFKEEAIAWAWELLTEVFKMDPARIYATYFGGDASQGLDADEEARQIWLKYLPSGRVLPFDCKDNFWEMGDQGPCGPCTEIHYDRIGGRDAADLVNMDDPDVLEIWNVVFIQFNREADSSLKPLPDKHVDTGMGMERVVSVLQNKRSNYATDVFAPIFDEIAKVTGARAYTDKVGKDDVDGKDMAYRVVADHIRTLSFAIADGARPGNLGRDYVLRRVLRRAVRYGTEVLGAQEGFFSKLVDVVGDHMGTFFPELLAAKETIRAVLSEEETSFGKTLKKGIERFHAMAGSVDGKVFSGTDAFQLWDTYGFPVDLTQLMAEEKGLDVDMPGFEAAMEAARQLSREGGKSDGGIKLKIAAEETAWLLNKGVAPTDDKPKYVEEDVSTTVKAILGLEGYVDSTANAPEGPVALILDATSFYGEAGGQVADTGSVVSSSGASLEVTAATVARGYVFHTGQKPASAIKAGDSVTAKVDYPRRHLIMPNHTMTHVLNYALRSVLGEAVDQKGSLVNDQYLRFDFSNNSQVSPENLGKCEAIVREQIAASLGVYAKDVAKNDALKINGLRAVFGEDYPDPVRVLSVGVPVEQLLAEPEKETNAAHSIEFCGGTHLTNTSQAKSFAIISEEGIAKGIRRIVAYTAGAADAAIAEGARLETALKAADSLAAEELEAAVNALKVEVDTSVIPFSKKAELRTIVTSLHTKVMDFKKAQAAENKKKATTLAVASADEAAAAGAAFVITKVDVGLDTKAVIEACTAIQKKHASMAVMLLSADSEKEKALAYAGVPENMTSKLPAGEWVKSALEVLGGKGGGKPTNAQGQGPNWQKVDEAMDVAKQLAALKL
mmetsp:Transcript_13459/g.33912  ORF Transcript_13459/g.33912 Transcript_13459/m.33912 type:complete len:1162 (-) Transcript_13459:153-3638(-)|eukprot:jgi/Tetstr1/454458/TSEL_041358.t1